MTCEITGTTASTAVSIARMYCKTKLVEVKRFKSSAGIASSKEIEENLTMLAVSSKKLVALKTNTASRKWKALARE